VKVRYRLVGIASVTAVAAICFMDAGVASAATPFTIRNADSQFLVGNGQGNKVIVSTLTGDASKFGTTNPSTWTGSNRPLNEYQQDTSSGSPSGLCMEYQGGPPDQGDITMEPCTAGRPSQEFWYSTTDNRLINVYASSAGQFDQVACTGTTGDTGDAVVNDCADHHPDQQWTGPPTS